MLLCFRCVCLACLLAWLVVVWCCGCGVACVLWHAENLRVSIQNASVYTVKTSPCMPATRVHVEKHVRVFAGTHGDVWNVHTGCVLDEHTVLLAKICPRKVITCSRGSPKQPWTLPILSWRTRRARHVPDFSNHSHYLNTLMNSCYPEGNCGRNKLLNGMD